MAVQGTYSSLSYVGVDATNPPQFVLYNRAPTKFDFFNFNLGTIWVHQIQVVGTPPTYTTSTMYILVALAQNIATWVKLGGSGPVGTEAINVVEFNTPGAFTYTPTPGMVQVQVECLGGGGPGYNFNVQGQTSPYHHLTGDPITVSTYVPSGAAGGYCKRTFTAAQIGASQAVVVGAGGVASTFALDSEIGYQDYTWNIATAGGNTTFGSFMTAYGASVPPLYYTVLNLNALGAAGGLATGGDLNVSGQNSPTVASNAAQSVLGGANSMYGSGGIGMVSAGTIPPLPGLGYGSGGSNYNYITIVGNVTTTVGSNGAPGLCLITEYF